MWGLFTHGDLQGLLPQADAALEAWVQQKWSSGWEEAGIYMLEEARATMTEVNDVTWLISVLFPGCKPKMEALDISGSISSGTVKTSSSSEQSCSTPHVGVDAIFSIEHRPWWNPQR